MGSNGASGGGGSPNQQAKDKAAANNRERARGGSQVSTGKSRSSASTGTSNVGGSGDGGNNNSSYGIVTNSGASLRAATPTIAEVSQATATDATADTIETRKKKAKAQGRSMTILKSAQGATDQGLTLGKRSLLGS